MCEIAIMTHSHNHLDPEKDRRGCWKAGMTVCVQDDGWGWSECEQASFKILKMPGISKGEVSRLTEIQYYVTGNPESGHYRRRRYRLPLTAITAQLENKISNSSIANATRINALYAELLEYPGPI